MSDDRTEETKDTRPFESRVFARFDSIDNRFDRLEGRVAAVEIKVTNLDAKRYDTKPIWERALAEIVELNRAISAQRSEFQTGMENLRTDLRSEFQTRIDALQTEMKAEFATIRHEMEHGLRGIARTVDTLNHNVLEMQTYQRYVDKRLEILETQVK